MAADLEGRVVLLVDNDAPFREAAAEALRAAGCEVEVAEDGQRGWECLVKGLRPCVIVLDLLMAGNGWRFRERQRDNPEWERIPVIIVSGASGGEHLLTQLGVPPERFLQKPFPLEDLVALIRITCG